MNLIEIKIAGTDYRDIRHQAARLFGFTENTGGKVETSQAVTPLPEAPEEIAEPKKAAPKKKTPTPKVEAEPIPEVAEPALPEPITPEPDPAVPVAVEPFSLKEELREVLKQMVAVEKEAEVKTIFEKYGASKMSDLKEKDYAAILAELKAVL